MLRGVNMKEKILIENGTIIDGTGSKEYTGNVVIKDNKIIAVGESAKKFSEDKDIKRIDASQKFVMPGIIDAHCHISFDEPTSNDELFFHRRQALAAIISGHNARKVLLAGVTGFCDPDSLHEIGIDLKPFFNQYLRDTKIPVFEYKILENKMHYRWSNVVENFNMPIEIIIDNSKRWIYPTESWKISNLNFQKIDIDKDYYVKVKNTK